MLVERSSGIVVPVAVADSHARSSGATYDSDGRRRVVLTATERRQFDRVIRTMKTIGMGIVLACREGKRPDGRQACGQPLVPEGVGTPDPCYVCLCTRIHVAG